jgi:two-component system LytT family response regulator
MPQALLIDDEATARADLRAKLAAHPEVVVLAEAATVRSARTLLARADYDLVFLDIQLVGGNAFDLVPDVRPGARIVFATAFDHYAVRAFEINALDYLLKPVEPARLAATLRRFAAGPAPAPDAAPPDGTTDAADPAPTTPLRPDDSVFLRSGPRARFVRVTDISVVAASDNYSEVHLADGSRLLLRRSLKVWEDLLPATHFMRVHRTLIANLARVTRYERDGDEHTLLFLQGFPDPVSASRHRWPELRDRLAALHPGS